MEKKNDGGPAFPSKVMTYEPDKWEGMTMRDYFAGQALAGLIASETEGSTYSQGYAAERAYKLADAMLEEREK